MKISMVAKQLADDLGLSDVDAYIMELKAKLYSRSAELVKSSKLTHEQIAKLIGTSRSRITLIAVLEGKPSIKFAA